LSYCPLLITSELLTSKLTAGEPPGSHCDPVQERSRHRADHHQLMKSTLPGALRRTIWPDRANLAGPDPRDVPH